MAAMRSVNIREWENNPQKIYKSKFSADNNARCHQIELPLYPFRILILSFQVELI